ncbi:hypothetical protein TPHA_0D03160 [Tetrapisispora phaffii CBS 4417]|uniref:Uncharacterized protein n=1 Tax=Tetrapisispora phaffii (strain ATCC 24235 / CBS 4417 / NBRC 1672 / NRRL Y-8282 / UCD 70-5) TaxID=1071381 RepID=G8BSY1_TETPH|nr:hypothetical protein TPHA_0D03160 [Tetrapisispora phaffii CBS 4417]CCE62952.1 hypothetical protein TPHA_0D03160 [Tetrapisispora phaffii CBS 4417]
MLKKFIQNNCLVFNYRLRYRKLSSQNELYVMRHVTKRLSEFGKLLYVKPNFKTVESSIGNKPSSIDVVIASSNLESLSRVLFNIKAIQLPNLASVKPISHLNIESADCENKQSLADLTNDNHEYLESVENSLLEEWSKYSFPSGNTTMRNYEASNSICEITLDNTIYFNSFPSKITKLDLEASNKETDSISFNKYRIDYFINQNRFEKLHDPRLQKDSYQSSLKDSLKLFPYLFKDYETLPGSLKKWMSSIDQEGHGTEMSDREKHSLDILFHGFK